MRPNLKQADIPFLAAGAPVSSSSAWPNDTFDTYTDLVGLSGLAGGDNWLGAWVDATGPTGITDYDDLESYADGVALNALNNRVSGFPSAFVDAGSLVNLIYSNDDLESYSDAASLNSLNGGTGWNGAFVDA